MCGPCGHKWTGAYLPMDLGRFAKMMAAIHCPNCGEDSRSIFAHEEAPSG